jgi:hypothetical protein
MRGLFLSALGAAAFAATGAAAAPQSPKDGETSAAEALIANCNAHKFETTVQTMVDGKPHASKVKLCGKAGQSAAEWLVTLKDALATVAANPKMATEVKTQITAGLKSEIAMVEAGIAADREATATPVIAPIPAPTVAQPQSHIAPAAATIPSQPLPHLKLQCYAPGDLGSGGPCTTLARDTLLTVAVEGSLGSGGTLRFVHDGEVRGEIALAPMRKGQSRRVKLPPAVCSGGGTSSVAIQLVGPDAAQASGNALGPFPLRC